MKILLTGAGGMLSRDLLQRLLQQKWAFQALLKEDLDITDRQAIAKTMKQYKPAVVVNCAAYTQVDRAESEANLAFAVNHLGAENLAWVCADQGVRFIHISTDFVFDGDQRRPYRENDATFPKGVYARSKRLGEEAILQSAADYLIIRTSWLYGEHGNNFVKTILKHAHKKSELKVVHDQVGSPTWTVDLADAIVRLIDVTAKGIVHFSNFGQCSWYEFAEEIVKQGYNVGILTQIPLVKPITSADWPSPVTRPAYSVLDTQLYQSLTMQTPPYWQPSLTKMIQQLAHSLK